MARTKIDFGIDLGTTNSSIAKMHHAEVKIIKSDKEMMDTTPSCVSFIKKKRMTIGKKSKNNYDKETLKAFMDYSMSNTVDDPNGFIEFKRTMGTKATYKSSYMERVYNSEELSAEMLKKLKSYEIDEDIKAIVITIPMMFRQLQKDATLRAAKMAGFQYCELLQEPIAASIAYGMSAQKAEGYWLVFDFGGGTFDAALMSANEGIIKVIGTNGDNHLGGKDIDIAIVDKILIPYLQNNYSIENILDDEKGKKLLRDALKIHAEEIKKEIAQRDIINYIGDEPLGEDDDGEEIELDLRLTLSDVEKAIKPVFQKAIDISLELLQTNNMTGNDLQKILLVGGPTLMQTIRNMLKKQITENVDVSIDPMTCVAEGAAIFASTRNIPIDLQQRDTTKVQLKIRYPETTVEATESVGILIEHNKTDGVIPETLFLEVIRADKGWTTGKIEMQDDSEIVEILLFEGRANGFYISLTDVNGNKLACEPDNFTIIQGMKAPSAVLERYITIGIHHFEDNKDIVIPLIGLEEGKTLPASGKASLKTQKDLRPGNPDDKIEIPLYASKGVEELYSRLELNEQIGEFIISGEDIEDFVPKDTDVQIRLELDSSFKKKLTVFFEYTDQEVVLEKDTYQENVPSYDDLEELIEKASVALDMQQSNDDTVSDAAVNQLNGQLEDHEEALNNANSEEERIQVHENLKKTLHKIDKLERNGMWHKTEKELLNGLSRLENIIDKFGDENDKVLGHEIHEKVNKVVLEKNVSLANDTLQEIYRLEFTVLRKDIGWWISWIKDYDENFDNYSWKNRTAAFNEIRKARENIMDKPDLEILEAIVRELWSLQKELTDPIISGRSGNLLRE